MKVILASPRDKTVLGIIGGYCKKALESLGNEVMVFDFHERPYSKNKIISSLKSVIRPIFPSLPSPYDAPIVRNLTDQRLNSELIDISDKYRPELLLVLLGENIFPQTLDRIRKERGVICANWIFDTLLLPSRRKLFCSVSSSYDFLFVIDSQGAQRYSDIAANHIETLPLACEPEVHRRIKLTPQEIKKYGSDVVFVGTLNPEREKILESLSDFDLGIWGRWSSESVRLKKCYRERDIYAREAAKIYNASKIVIDIHSLYGKKKDISSVTPRVFEVPACGAFLLTNESSQLADFYKIPEEMVTYKNVKHLKYLIRYYLGHTEARKLIAEKAYQRAQSEHTYIRRIEKIMSSVGEKINSKDGKVYGKDQCLIFT